MRLSNAFQLALLVTLLFAGAFSAEEDGEIEAPMEPTEVPVVTATTEKPYYVTDYEHYPIAWTAFNFQAIVDNTRLFNKYKECLIADKPRGCPRDVTEFRKVIPEILETMCAKCLPAHIEMAKNAVSYICKKRREVYEEVRRLKDPDHEVQNKFEEKFGKPDC